MYYLIEIGLEHKEQHLNSLPNTIRIRKQLKSLSWLSRNGCYVYSSEIFPISAFKDRSLFSGAKCVLVAHIRKGGKYLSFQAGFASYDVLKSYIFRCKFLEYKSSHDYYKDFGWDTI